MPKKDLAVNSYSGLLSQIKSVFLEGLKRIEQEKVKAYWITGKLISDYVLNNKERAPHGKNLLSRLSADLNIEISTLQRTVQFYRAFPNSAAQRNLTWMHYRQLVTIEDKTKRKVFAERAAKKEWGYRELEEAIRLERLKIDEPKEKPKSAVVKLNTTRSRLFTYQVLEPGYVTAKEEESVIDLGFSINIQSQILQVANLKPGEIIETEKSAKAYSFKRSDAKPKELYTYVAQVERVVDADTIWLNIDCGFKVWTRQKVRLRGIDAQELSTKEGQEAKKFVEAKLKEVEFIVVKTYKSDKFDRYLTDIFYLKDKNQPQLVLEQGIFLNQQLLDLNLAKLWQI